MDAAALELVTKVCWALLGVLHAMPSAAFFFPGTTEKLYGVSGKGDVGILLTHRACLFLALVVVAAYAIFDPEARRTATLIFGISMVGFLLVYARAGMPKGSLRAIAWADLLGLLPYLLVAAAAWSDALSG